MKRERNVLKKNEKETEIHTHTHIQRETEEGILKKCTDKEH